MSAAGAIKKKLLELDNAVVSAQSQLDKELHRTRQESWGPTRDLTIEDHVVRARLEARLEAAHAHHQKLESVRRLLAELGEEPALQ